MNKILAETNRISEAMVRETRRNRYAAVAPKVELRLGSSVETHDNDLGVTLNDNIVVRATNTSEWKAYEVTLVEPVPTSGRRQDLDPKKGTTFEIPRSAPEPVRYVVSYFDEFGNRWETIFQEGRHTPRLVEEAE